MEDVATEFQVQGLENDWSADFPGWRQWIIMNKVVPLPYGTDQATTCHPSGCAYRQL